MTVLSIEHPTLLDISRHAQQGMSAGMAREHEKTSELLMQSNGFIENIAWKIGNSQDGHQFTYRVKNTTPTWRRLNYGVRPQKGVRDQISVTAGHMVSYWEADSVVMETGGQLAMNLEEEMEAFHQGNSNELERAAIYGAESSTPEEFTGFMRYYDKLSGPTGSNLVLDAGGSTNDMKSIILVGSGTSATSMFVPAGRPMGFTIKSPSASGRLGDTFFSQTAPVLGTTDTDGRMEVYGQYFKCWAGLVVQDTRYSGRICNIDHKKLTPTGYAADGTTRSGAVLHELMQDLLTRVNKKAGVKQFFVMPKGLVATLIRQERHELVNSTLTRMDMGRHEVMEASFGGVPIMISDEMDQMAEARVTA